VAYLGDVNSVSKIYYEADADLSVLSGKKIAVIGFGNQGRSREVSEKGGLKEAFMHVSENSVDVPTAWGPAEKCIKGGIRCRRSKTPPILPVGGDMELAIRAGQGYATETI
jgi:hypothetical protein